MDYSFVPAGKDQTTTFTVIHTNYSGPGLLRSAMFEAQTDPLVD